MKAKGVFWQTKCEPFESCSWRPSDKRQQGSREDVTGNIYSLPFHACPIKLNFLQTISLIWTLLSKSSACLLLTCNHLTYFFRAEPICRLHACRGESTHRVPGFSDKRACTSICLRVAVCLMRIAELEGRVQQMARTRSFRRGNMR